MASDYSSDQKVKIVHMPLELIRAGEKVMQDVRKKQDLELSIEAEQHKIESVITPEIYLKTGIDYTRKISEESRQVKQSFFTKIRDYICKIY